MLAQYDRIALRKAHHLNDLQLAEEKTIWTKHETGPMSKYIWAPELHHINGAWYIYFAAAQVDFSADALPTHRIYVLENKDEDPFSDNWEEKGQINTGWESFSLDATTAVINGTQYLAWTPTTRDVLAADGKPEHVLTTDLHRPDEK